MVVAFLSLGSNLGNRLRYLMLALEQLKTLGTVTGYSRLYSTDPILYTNQPDFLNCAVRLETTLTPAELLRHVKLIESALGRSFSVAKGPREIDIDISLYGEEIVDTPDLTIPHPGVTQRDFVIRTLLDIDSTLRVQGKPLLEWLPTAFISHPRLSFATSRRVFEYGQRTLVFGIVDGGVDCALRQLAEGADVLDLELGSLPLLKLLRSDSRLADAVISVSAATPQEAEEALAAGADIIRDESGLCAPVCSLTPYIYIRQSSPSNYQGFNAMVDIGLGLTEQENLQVLRSLPQLKAACHLPLLLSVPKQLLRSVYPEQSAQAGFFGIVGVAAQAKVDFVRTQDVEQTRSYLRTADFLR